MSKAMAIEGIMQIFLMVAVIVVGMSFLLKAFGIDLLGWLQNLFGGLGITDGKILYVKMDPDDKEVFAFFLAQESNMIQEIDKYYVLVHGQLHTYFLPDTLDKKFCAIYTVKERDNSFLGPISVFPIQTSDKGFYYYIKPGAIIQKDTCSSIGDCIKSYVADFGCVEKEVDCGPSLLTAEIELEKCYSQLKGKFVVGDCGCVGTPKCDDGGAILDKSTDREVEKEEFQPNYNFKDPCNVDKSTSKCNLLVPGEYNIKFGLLCDDDGKWHVCKKETGSTQITAYVNNTLIECNPSGDVFQWDENDLQDALIAPEKPIQLFGSSEYEIEPTDLVESGNAIHINVNIISTIDETRVCNLKVKFMPKDVIKDVQQLIIKGKESSIGGTAYVKSDIAKSGENQLYAGCNDDFKLNIMFCGDDQIKDELGTCVNA